MFVPSKLQTKVTEIVQEYVNTGSVDYSFII